MNHSLKSQNSGKEKSSLKILTSNNEIHQSSKSPKISNTSDIGNINFNLSSKNSQSVSPKANIERASMIEEQKNTSKKETFYVGEESFYTEMLAAFYQFAFLERNEYYKSLILNQPKRYLGPRPNVKSNKTIVINLEETIVTDFSFNPDDLISVDETSIRQCYKKDIKTYENQMNFAIRPFALEFLKSISKIYEVIVE